MKFFKSRTIWWPTWQTWLLFFLILTSLFILFFINAHRFLAVTSRIKDADTLVIENWGSEAIVRVAVREYKEGNYQLLIISGLNKYDDQNNTSQNVRKSYRFNRIVSLGVPKEQILECYITTTNNHRSAAMAHSVINALWQGSFTTKGINVMAPATHARKTWLVYRRALSSEVPVGIVAVFPGGYDPARWWKNSQSAKWVINNYAGLLYEWITGI